MDEQMALYIAVGRYWMEHAPALNPQYEEQWYRDRPWTQNRSSL